MSDKTAFEVVHERSSRETQIVLGLAVQPLVAALLGSLFFPFLALTDPRLKSSSPTLEIGLMSAAVVGAAGLLITVLAAAPVFYWLCGRGTVTWRHALVSGVLCANIPTALLLGLVFFNGRDPRLSDLDFLMIALRVGVLASCIGAVSASVFWGIAAGGFANAIRGRKDASLLA
jgi:hypothetical protein